MDLASFLVAVYVLVDEWGQDQEAPVARRPGRPTELRESEVLTLALVAQGPRWRSARDFWRFAHAHLPPYFPALGSQSQFNRRVRAAEPALRALHAALAALLEGPHAAYHVLDTTLIPAVVRVRACRQGLCAGQASFGGCVSKTEWVYGFKVALSVTPAGLITAFGLAPAACDERSSGNALIAAAGHDAYLADKGYASLTWEQHWQQTYGALVAPRPSRPLGGRGPRPPAGGRTGTGRSSSRSLLNSRISSPWSGTAPRLLAACSRVSPPRWSPSPPAYGSMPPWPPLAPLG